MRIIGGALGGRTLRAPRGQATRPTSDRVREALFNILGPLDPAARVLDLYAGTGALGLEALSRGASAAVFVDRGEEAARTLAKNIEQLGLGPRAQVIRGDVVPTLTRLCAAAGPPFALVFIDPPYATDEAMQSLTALAGSCDVLLHPEAVVVVEHDRRRPPADHVETLALAFRRRYGDTEVSLYRRGPST